VNEPHIGFDDAEGKPSTQTVELTKAQLNGTAIPLKFVKFQNVRSLQLFFPDNQDDTDITFINRITFNGVPVDKFDVAEIKKPEEHD
jgi:hypothetical protein